MEGTPFAVESNNEDDKEKRDEEEERTSKVKKPEVFGMLAVESPASEDKPTVFEKAWEATRKPDEEAEEVKEKPEPASVQHVETPEPEPKPEAEIRPVIEAEPEPKAEEEPVEIPEAPKVEAPEPEPVVMAEVEEPEPAEKPEPASVQHVETPEPEPKPEAEIRPVIEAEPEPKAEEEPVEIPEAPKVEAPEPEPVVMAEAEPEATEKSETSPDDDDKKPGFIRSLFGRGDREKDEKQPEPPVEKAKPEAVEEVKEPEAAVVEDAPKAEAEAEKPKFEFKEKTDESAVEKPEAAEAPEEPEKPEIERDPEAKAGRIGQVLLNTEAAPVERLAKPVNEAAASSQEAEKKLHVEASPIEPVSGRRVDTLSQPELMQLSEKIEINGNNLRHIYETHLIGERGLRRLVAEHLRGGDLAKALRREVMEHEMDFERDPVMRNLKQTDASPLDGNSAVLEKLLEKADVSLADADNPTVSFKAPGRQKKVRRQWQSHRYRSLDIILVVTISGLSLLIILVLLLKG